MTATENATKTYRWDKTRIVWRAIDDELYLLDISTGHHFSLNPVGQDIWLALDKGHTVRDVASLVAEKYQIDDTRALEDVMALVDELLRENLLEEQA